MCQELLMSYYKMKIKRVESIEKKHSPSMWYTQLLLRMRTIAKN